MYREFVQMPGRKNWYIDYLNQLSVKTQKTV